MVQATKGWVYVITTKTHNLVKIGYTDRDPKVRAAELNDTSSPHPHVVRYAALVKAPKTVERLVHKKLAQQQEGKEWFDISVEAAVICIRVNAGEILFEEDSGSISQEQIKKLETERKEEAANKEIWRTELEQRRKEIIEKERRRYPPMNPNQRELHVKHRANQRELQAAEHQAKKADINAKQKAFDLKVFGWLFFISFFIFCYLAWNE